MGLFESEADKQLRLKIAAEEKAKYDAEELERKTKLFRKQERAKLESGGFSGYLKSQAKKVMKEAAKGIQDSANGK
jgi:hypothetical protein